MPAWVLHSGELTLMQSKKYPSLRLSKAVTITGIKLHKQSFNALLRCKVNQHLPVGDIMKKAIAYLRKEANSSNLQALLHLDVFQEFC